MRLDEWVLVDILGVISFVIVIRIRALARCHCPDPSLYLLAILLCNVATK
jgi:hypothetical protein